MVIKTWARAKPGQPTGERGQVASSKEARCTRVLFYWNILDPVRIKISPSLSRYLHRCFKSSREKLRKPRSRQGTTHSPGSGLGVALPVVCDSPSECRSQRPCCTRAPLVEREGGEGGGVGRGAVTVEQVPPPAPTRGRQGTRPGPGSAPCHRPRSCRPRISVRPQPASPRSLSASRGSLPPHRGAAISGQNIQLSPAPRRDLSAIPSINSHRLGWPSGGPVPQFGDRVAGPRVPAASRAQS